MAANIEHIEPDLALIHMMDVEYIPADLFTGLEFPGDLDIVYLRRSGWEQTLLDGGCRFQVPIQLFLLVLQLNFLLLYIGHIVNDDQKHFAPLIHNCPGAELKVLFNGFAVDVEDTVQRLIVHRDPIRKGLYQGAAQNALGAMGRLPAGFVFRYGIDTSGRLTEA